MKAKFFLLIIALGANAALGQDFDNLMTKKVLNCSDISYNSSLYYVKYMSESKLDSAKSLMKYWEDRCGLTEPVYRAKILLALKSEQYNDSLLSEYPIYMIYNYQNRMGMVKSANYYWYDDYKSYYGYVPVGQEFDNYTRKEALNLKSKYPQESFEYLLTEFYSDNSDTILSKIQQPAYQQTTLAEKHKAEVEKYVNIGDFHMAWITGVWIPTGRLTKLGVHPELGFQMGAKKKKMNYDLTMSFKFGKSPNSFYARRDKSSDNLELTNKFFGGYVGFDIGRDMYTKNGHELQLIGGIAFDGFTVLDEDKELGLKSASANSYNFNFGVAYRYYITNEFYLGGRVKYNIVDYSLSKTIDFTGNPITIQLTIGGLLDNKLKNKNANLKALKYKLRK